MTLSSRGIRDAILSHVLASGQCDQVAGHEPKNAPGNGVSAAFIFGEGRAVPARSGLSTVSVRLETTIRLFLPMLVEPQDEIDPRLLDACDALMSAWCGDFELGGMVAHVDLLGAHGNPLKWEPGYFNQDGKLYRGLVITLPVMIDDLWSQNG